VDITISGATTPVQLQAIDFRVTTIAFGRRAAALSGRKVGAVRERGTALFKVKVTNRGNGELTTTAGRDDAWATSRRRLVMVRVESAALFAEYRFTHVHSEVACRAPSPAPGARPRFDLDSHHVVAGAS
jgi:hypothetical protein